MIDPTRKKKGDWWFRWQFVKGSVRVFITNLPLLVKAIGWGSLVTGGALVVFWGLWSVWMDKPSKAVDELNAELAFAAAVSAFITIFLGTLIGYYAIQEYREDHEAPELSVEWAEGHRAGPQDAELKISDPQVYYNLTLRLRNFSELIAKWYAVEVDMPILHAAWTQFGQPNDPEVVRSLMLSEVTILLGNTDNWYLYNERGRGEHDHIHKLRFTSHGQFGIFPETATDIASIRVQRTDIDETNLYNFAYRLLNEKGKPQLGWLTAKFGDTKRDTEVTNRIIDEYRKMHQHPPTIFNDWPL